LKYKPSVQINLSDYDYLENLDADGWHWEITRRNEGYRQAYDEMLQLQINAEDTCKNLDCFSCKVKSQGPMKCPLSQCYYVEEIFQIKPFYKAKEYGLNIPDPKLKYIKFPDQAKPLTTRRPVSPIKALTSFELERAIKNTWKVKKILYDQIWHSHDPEYAMYDFVHDILAPDPRSSEPREKEQQTLFIGISLTATRDDLRANFEKLLKRHVRPKTNRGDSKQAPEKWKSHIIIWDLRAERIPYTGIKSITGIAAATARKQFYRAYELIYGEKYNSATYLQPEIKKEYLKRHCNTCEVRLYCRDLCPDVLGYVNQDKIGMRQGTSMHEEYRKDSLQGYLSELAQIDES
jgi:hypothetical protein